MQTEAFNQHSYSAFTARTGFLADYQHEAHVEGKSVTLQKVIP